MRMLRADVAACLVIGSTLLPATSLVADEILEPKLIASDGEALDEVEEIAKLAGVFAPDVLSRKYLGKICEEARCSAYWELELSRRPRIVRIDYIRLDTGTWIVGPNSSEPKALRLDSQVDSTP